MPPKSKNIPKPKRAANSRAAAQVQAKFEEGLALHQKGRLAQAQELYQQVLKVQPKHFDALHLLGVIAAQTRNAERAVELIGKAIEVNPNNAAAYINRGVALQDLKQHEAALQSYDKAIVLKPDSAEAYNNRGKALRDLNQYEAALQSYDKAIALKPDYAEAYNNRGIALRDVKQHEAALQSYEKAIALKPDSAEAYNNRGIALQDLKQHEAALQSYDRAIALKPDSAEAYNNRGIALRDAKQHEAALQSYDRAIVLKPDYAEAYNNRGNALRELKQYESALQSHEKAIALVADYAEAYNNRGIALRNLKRHEAALQSYDRAIALKPDHAEAYNNRGNALRDLKQYEAALQSYDKAIAIKPDYAEGYNGRGIALQDLKRYPEAIASYDKALAINLDHPYAAGERTRCSAQIGDWKDHERIEKQIVGGVRSGQVLTQPFGLLAISDNPADQLNCARSYVEDRCPAVLSIIKKTSQCENDRIRVAYLSADFREHAMSYLMVGVLERHDLERFAVSAIDFESGKPGEMRSRLSRSFENFIDVRTQSDDGVAALVREMEVDIVVDLMGFTRNCRPGILALRPAPIQVNYLGYPGTMGADFIDYIIADEFVVPRGEQRHYAEKVVYLPDCFQANDSKREIGKRTPTRAEAGLPEHGFVFCCFNNSYKIKPDIFDVWMRILQRIENSVLWLLGEDDTTIANLRREAQSRGVEPNRLVFARRVEAQDYLARYRLADLFLDTLPFNAGTTASDALWAGLPLVTCAGKAFAARMAGSLLHAVGLPELVTHSLEDYEALVIKLATDENLLREVKEKLAANRLTKPLFDTDRFRRHIEAAYTTMWEIHQRGGEPRSFAVPPFDQSS